ncbi:hypothetical protein EUX98_g2658 [Antrodiella citrinella]|uniref:Dicer-like protein 1 n=1 Tax=Antrodiella citrinella TaxID=2447956 RepID=A0A4S4MYH7_9APHY|nr:hypothetical protein EUX98_g2658 [Antrodiella citrinella]
MTVNLDQVSEALLPRRYQEEIFSRAQARNVIAALDTGSGKTYISTLLIKWIATQNAGKGKTIIFLVPKVALVEQQGDFIIRETSLRVSKCYGATAIDLSDRRGWKKEILEHDVLVMTAQIFLNILTHSHWSMDKVALIVFDECHHTRKNHAYNGIMREYFQWPSEQRPKIFGMTASPIWNPRDAVESLLTLERNLDAKVIAVREHVDELQDHSPKPAEIVHTYPTPPDNYPLYAPTTLWDRLDLGDLPSELDIPVSKIRTSYQNQTDEHSDYLYPSGMEDIDDIARTKESTPELLELESILAEFQPLFEDPINPQMVPVNVDLTWCSPKLRLLADLLVQHYATGFQGIVFVEQRHVAACLSKMLPKIPQLEHYIRSGQLIGHGASNVAKSQVRGMALRTQQDVVKLFRDNIVNLLVATSVAEEGLDFPACELVIRFDPIQHMVGYIQSRGRARQKLATFIVMIQEGAAAHVERYRAFTESEPQLRAVYQSRDDSAVIPVVEEEEGEILDPEDLAERERYVVPSTGAVLTYNTAISLLNHLCSLIPRDKFTPVHVPHYTGDFTATLMLPSTLPLPLRDLRFVGPERRSKKEAKRAVAFVAVKRLHSLNVFDDYLLPTKSHTGDNEDADGRCIDDVSQIPDTMDVMVRDPWTRSETQWLHVVNIDGVAVAGLVTGTALPVVELVCNGQFISIEEGQYIRFSREDQYRQRRALEDFTRMGLGWCITGRGITLPLTCYLVPITHNHTPDWETIYKTVTEPFGCSDWSSIGKEHYDHLFVMSSREHGRPFLLRRIRDDLSPMSTPPPTSREAAFSSYRDYFINKYTKRGVSPEIPTDGPCLEVSKFPRHVTSIYNFNGSSLTQPPAGSLDTQILIQEMCRWCTIPEKVYHTFHILPELCYRITDVYRARAARLELGLPPVIDDLLVQAFVLPSASAGFNNQRLETLGDSVLKVCTVVHLFNRFPHRHEGQLDILRRNSVSNRTLLARAKECGLEHYLTSEPRTTRIWRFTLPENGDPSDDTPCRSVARRFPRRSLQDCMEATLGAAFVTGGINMVLRTATALGLGFGGPIPWQLRYTGQVENHPVSALFRTLEEQLGYQFRNGRLLVEAMTHPSFKSTDSTSYQRLEFLGDALIDLVTMRYLYNKFPSATSGQLSWARSRAVCAPALASVAIKRLGLHKMVLINNVELSIAISRYVPVLEETSDIEIIHSGWKQDPPKAISDVLESVLGAVFVDCGWDFERACVVAENALYDLLVTLSPNMPRDPVSNLMVWSAQSGCRKISFQKSQSRQEVKRNDSISVIAHDYAVVGPIPASNLSLAKGLAAERARQILDDPNGPYYLGNICDCADAMAVDHGDTPSFDMPTDMLNDETEEGFAALARIVAQDVIALTVPTEEVEVEVQDEEDDFAVPTQEMSATTIRSDYVEGEVFRMPDIIHTFVSMAHIATPTFLANVKVLLSEENRSVVSRRWYVLAAAAFSASNIPEAIPLIFENALEELEQETERKPDELRRDQLAVARRMRECVFRAGMLTGYARAINSLTALHTVMPKELKDTSVLSEDGHALFNAMYGNSAEEVQEILDDIHPDMGQHTACVHVQMNIALTDELRTGWFSNTIAYGIVYGGSDVLSQMEVSFIMSVVNIVMDTPKQAGWHLRNASNIGASPQEVEAVRRIATVVASGCGVVFKAER